ncbi:membrane cofactor protein-like [Odocoileus virginianus]|uniref:Membrane cofactor protein n=1 Tax=Odocoileus virginianus TaxID=9874 RepID=A0ABM4ISF6_ODOVR
MLLVVLVLLLPTVSEACGDPPRFDTMRLQGAPKPNYRPGECVQYECRLGFKPKVPTLPRSAVCQDNNTWSSLQDACVEKSCPNVGDPVNGQVNFVNGSALFGSQVHFACNPGFYLIGAKILYCEISGDNVAWSDNLPICEIIVCAAPGNITNGRFTVYKEVYQYSEVVMYRCNPSNGPDEYSLIGETTLICVDHNRWSSAPPECKVVKCDYPIVEYAAIASGVRRKYYYNAQVVFQCHDGFYLHGNSTVVCGANGTWEPELPKCTKEAIATTTVSTTSSASAYPNPTDDLQPGGFQDLDTALITAIILSVCTAVWVENSLGEFFPLLDGAVSSLRPWALHCAVWTFSCYSQAALVGSRAFRLSSCGPQD